MIVVVCGMHRSGSTLVWQIAHELLEGDRRIRVLATQPTRRMKLLALNPWRTYMWKVHYRKEIKATHFPDAGARYLFTFRDPRDVAASLVRKGRWVEGHPKRSPEQLAEIVRTELVGGMFWRKREHLWIGKYEAFSTDIPRLITDIAQFLGIRQVDEDDVARIAAYVALDRQRERSTLARSQEKDLRSRITTNHITDGRHGAWRETLTDEEVAAIEKVSHRWMLRNGYLP